MQDIADLGRGGALLGAVNVRQNRYFERFFDMLKYLQSRVEANSALAAEGGTIGLVERSFKDELRSSGGASLFQVAGNHLGMSGGFQLARARY